MRTTLGGRATVAAGAAPAARDPPPTIRQTAAPRRVETAGFERGTGTSGFARVHTTRRLEERESQFL